MVLLGYSGARGTLIYEKNLKPKISCQTPFNAYFKTHIFNWKNINFYCVAQTYVLNRYCTTFQHALEINKGLPEVAINRHK